MLLICWQIAYEVLMDIIDINAKLNYEINFIKYHFPGAPVFFLFI
jgi:hypothetical protein